MSPVLFTLGLCLGSWLTAAALVFYAALVAAARADRNQPPVLAEE